MLRKMKAIGIAHSFADIKPTRVSFQMRCAPVDGWCITDVGAGGSLARVRFFPDSPGSAADLTGHMDLRAATIDANWYSIVLSNIDWTNHTFDYAISGSFRTGGAKSKQGVPFADPTSADSLSYIGLYPVTPYLLTPQSGSWDSLRAE